MRRVGVYVLASALSLSSAGCFRGEDPNLTEAGLGKPVVEVDFPATAAAGSTQTAALSVSNPGPGDMSSVVVAFAALGDPRLPRAIVGIGSKGRTRGVVSVDPVPSSVSEDGMVYVFDGPGNEVVLAEGESLTIRFRLRVPKQPGAAANSVTVYDGQAIDRARGVRLETLVE